PVSLKGALELRGLVALSNCRSARIVRREEARLEDDTVGGQLVEEVRLQARARQGRQKANRPTVPGLSLLVGRLGDEDVLKRDHVGLHAQDLGDVRDAARAVDETGDLYEQIEC